MLELAQLLISVAGFGVPMGIMLLMAGRVRVRNEFDTLARSVAAFCIAMVCYWLVGRGLIESSSLFGFLGYGEGMLGFSDRGITVDDLHFTALFVIPAMIVSTAMAERGEFYGGSVLVAIVSVLVIPLISHWAWTDNPNGQGWLAAHGFSDKSGTIVIFVAAGAVGLASSSAIGPRSGRFPLRMSRPSGHSPTAYILGMMSIIISITMISVWQTDQLSVMPEIFFKVLLGTCFAVVSALILLLARGKRGSAFDLVTAALSGSIALTTFAPYIQPANAALIGMFTGTVTMGVRRMLNTIEVDDPGDLIAAFLSGGLMGGLLTPVLWSGSSNALINQVVMQVLGITAIFLWSFGLTFIFAHAISRVWTLRVNRANEARGLSRVHFGIQSETDFVFSQSEQRSNAMPYSEAKEGHEELSVLSNSFSQAIIRLRNETHRAAERIQSSCNIKQSAAMITRIRLAEDTLRVKSEDILLLLESTLVGSRTTASSMEFQLWLQDVLRLVLDPTLSNLAQLARHLPLQAEFEELENIILAAAEAVTHCAHQMELLQDFADAQVEGFFSRDHTCDLAQLLDEKSSRLKALAEVRNSPIQIDCPVREGLIVSGDVKAFTRILSLAVEGALNRLSSQDGRPVRLELREHTSGNHVVFECLDTGSALSSRQVRAIVDPLESEQGMEGLGLTQILPLMLVAKLVDAVGGELTLSSEEGLGTLLHCRFRRRTARIQQDGAAAA